MNTSPNPSFLTGESKAGRCLGPSSTKPFSIANVALAAGTLQFPVSPAMQTWGAMASVITGTGTVLSGIGDLRNE